MSNLVLEKAKPLSYEERFEMLINEGTNTIEAETSTTTLSKIQKFPSFLRERKEFNKYYEPRVVSIGPIHHGNPKFQPAEKHKLRLAYKFFQESGKKHLKDLHGVVQKEIKKLRECFEEEVTKRYDDEALAWMLFVDGCAMLQSIKSDFEREPFGKHDMLLLENQLPYCLLEWLMSCSNKKTELRNSINTFIDNSINYTVPLRARTSEQWVSSLLNIPLTREKRKQGENTHSQLKLPGHNISIEGENTHSQPAHLLDLLRTGLLGRPIKHNPVTPDYKKKNKQYDWQPFRNVQELKAAGISFKHSENSFLRNISFTRFLNFYTGRLQLPRITVDHSTMAMFMNLIAYEMCPDFENDYGVTSYISFLYSLIAQPIDVQELKKAGILYNCHGSDKEVAKLFSEIGTDLVPNPDAYKDVKNKIEEYYSNKLNWIVISFHKYVSFREYFNSRTFWAVIGALLALSLSAAQVYYALHPYQVQP